MGGGGQDSGSADLQIKRVAVQGPVKRQQMDYMSETYDSNPKELFIVNQYTNIHHRNHQMLPTKDNSMCHHPERVRLNNKSNEVRHKLKFKLAAHTGGVVGSCPTIHSGILLFRRNSECTSSYTPNSVMVRKWAQNRHATCVRQETEFRWESAPYHVPLGNICSCRTRGSVGTSCVWCPTQ